MPKYYGMLIAIIRPVEATFEKLPMFRSITLLTLVLFQLPSGICHSAEPDKPNSLEVRGKDLLYGGKTIQLRGVALGDPWMGRKDRPASDYELLAKDWKANVIRIGVHPRVWKTEPHDRVLDRLAQDVDAALKNGLFVIIDWHAIGWPDGYYQVSDYGPKDTYDSDFKLAKDFWTATAKRYGKDGRVLFEFWNEPVFQKNDWAADVGQKWSKFKPFMKELLDLVREQGDNVVIVSSNRWSYSQRRPQGFAGRKKRRLRLAHLRRPLEERSESVGRRARRLADGRAGPRDRVGFSTQFQAALQRHGRRFRQTLRSGFSGG